MADAVTAPGTETQRRLEAFATALFELEAAIERRAPIAKIGALDAQVAERTRELVALVHRIRSRRIA
jgi:hypothetical protein